VVGVTDVPNGSLEFRFRLERGAAVSAWSNVENVIINNSPNDPKEATYVVGAEVSTSGGWSWQPAPWGAVSSTETVADRTILPSIVASTDTFGTATVARLAITTTTLAVDDTFGTSIVSRGVRTTALAVDDTFGTATVATAGSAIIPTALTSDDTFGTATISTDGDAGFIHTGDAEFEAGDDQSPFSPGGSVG
jgi:hypothetical protein